jgi:hypothetical protein
MKDLFLYKAYGLAFLSEIPLPGLQIAEGQPDVTIRYGFVHNILPESSATGIQATRREFLLHVRDVASYYVADGNEIVIEPEGSFDEPGIRLFLFGSVFCALLQQRGYLVLHGSAIQVNSQGVLFTGVSGIGKSTLAAAFYQEGYRVLTDDVCAVMIDKQDTPYIIPGFPGIKLWKDAAERFGKNVTELVPVKKDLEKFQIEAGERFLDSTVALDKIFILHSADNRDIAIAQITGFHKLEAVIENTYRYRFVKAQGVNSLHFSQCAAVVNHARVYDVLRPKSGFFMHELVTAIEGDLVKDDK